jgi:hypothetical protein
LIYVKPCLIRELKVKYRFTDYSEYLWAYEFTYKPKMNVEKLEDFFKRVMESELFVAVLL